MDTLIRILITLGLVALNAFFVAAEFAAVGARRTRVEEHAKESLWGVLALRVKNSLDLYLSACQFGITVASLGLGFAAEEALVSAVEPWLGSLGIVENSHGIAVAIALGICTTLHVSVGEVAPKNVAIRIADRVLPLVAPALIVFTYLFYPIIWALNMLGNVLLRLCGMKVDHGEHEEPLHSRAEIEAIVRRSTKEGELQSMSSHVLSSALRFDELDVKQVMTPRIDVEYLTVGQTLDQVIEKLRKGAYSRFPLCSGSIDSVIGLVHSKDILSFLVADSDTSGTAKVFDLERICRPIHIVPDIMRLPDLWQKFQGTGTHMAAVFDEHGSMLGLITIEDVIEELVGEIDDEFDDRSRPLLWAEGSGYRALTTLPLHQFAQELGTSNFKASEGTTLNGYLIEVLGRMPIAGDRVVIEGYEIEVLKVLNKRTSEVQIAARTSGEQE